MIPPKYLYHYKAKYKVTVFTSWRPLTANLFSSQPLLISLQSQFLVVHTATCSLSNNQQISALTHHSKNSFEFPDHHIINAMPLFACRVLPCVLVYSLLLKYSIHHSQAILSTPGQQSFLIVICTTHSITAS